MSTCRPTVTQLSVGELAGTFNSLAAHIAAKLQSFASDERTLTDELCDMLCIWADPVARGAAQRQLGGPQVHLQLQKITPRQEAIIGADLELVVSTPRGSKRVLFQAKVIEPDTRLLRRRGSVDLAKLRWQLRAAAEETGSDDAAFLLLYVPGGMLDGMTWSYGTWEQGFLTKTSGSMSWSMGTTVVSMADLRHDGCWRYCPALRHVGNFGSSLEHMSLTRVILELVACRRGEVADVADSIKQTGLESVETSPFRTLRARFTPTEESTWEEIERGLNVIIDHPGEFNLAL